MIFIQIILFVALLAVLLYSTISVLRPRIALRKLYGINTQSNNYARCGFFRHGLPLEGWCIASEAGRLNFEPYIAGFSYQLDLADVKTIDTVLPIWTRLTLNSGERLHVIGFEASSLLKSISRNSSEKIPS